MVTQLKQALQRKLWQWFFSVDAAGRKVYSPFCQMCSAYCGCSHGLHEQKVFQTDKWELLCSDCAKHEDKRWQANWKWKK